MRILLNCLCMHVWYSTVLANMPKSLYTLYIGWTVSATASIVLLLASRVVISSSKYYCSAQNVVINSSLGMAMQGVLPNMIKLAPAAGISWFMFEEVKRMLGVDVRS